MTISQEEQSEWLQHPATVAFRKDLRVMVESIKEDWSKGLFIAESAEGTAQKNAVALGRIEILEYILDMTEVDDVADNS